MTIAEALRLVGEEDVREQTTREVTRRVTREVRRETIKENSREIACKLLKAGMGLSFIQEMTNLDINEIKALKAELAASSWF